MVNKLFDKKSSGDVVTHARSGPLAAKDYSAIMQDQQLSEKLHEPIIGKIEKRKVYLSSKNNI